MTPIFTRAESMERPPELEVGLTTVYLRRNITEVERIELDEEEAVTVYIYEEAKLTKDEALSMLTQDVADSDSINVDHEYRLTLLELGV